MSHTKKPTIEKIILALLGLLALAALVRTMFPVSYTHLTLPTSLCV